MEPYEELKELTVKLTQMVGSILPAANAQEQLNQTYLARINELNAENTTLRGKLQDLALDLDHGFTKNLGTGADAKLVRDVRLSSGAQLIVDLNEHPELASNRDNDMVDDGITLGTNPDGTTVPGGDVVSLNVAAGNTPKDDPDLVVADALSTSSNDSR